MAIKEIAAQHRELKIGKNPGEPIKNKKTKNHLILSLFSFQSGLLHFNTLQNFSLRLSFYTFENQSEILIIQLVL